LTAEAGNIWLEDYERFLTALRLLL
jgi:hypothetical protein